MKTSFVENKKVQTFHPTQVGLEWEWVVHAHDHLGRTCTPVNMEYVMPEHITKEDPYRFPDGSVMHPDCTMMEVAAPPSTSPTQAVANVYAAHRAAINWLNRNTPLNYAPVDTVCAATYDDNQLLSPSSRTLGCSPSRRVYAKSPQTPKEYANNQRFAGCHITVTATPLVNQDIDMFAKLCDLVLAIPAMYYLLSETLMEYERNRRKHYGMASEHRYKVLNQDDIDNPLCVFEYRVLSAAVYRSKALLVTTASRMLRLATEPAFYSSALDLYNSIKNIDDLLVRAINDCNIDTILHLNDKVQGALK